MEDIKTLPRVYSPVLLRIRVTYILKEKLFVVLVKMVEKTLFKGNSYNGLLHRGETSSSTSDRVRKSRHL